MIKKLEKELFESLTSGRFTNFALVEGLFRGTRAVFVSCINRKGEDYFITPLAVLLRTHDLDHCRGPEGESLSLDR